jgi:hypothetical protein
LVVRIVRAGFFAVLETLKNYIDDESSDAAVQTAQFRFRLRRTVAISVAAHAVFFVAVIRLDQWSYQLMVEQGRRPAGGGGQFEVIELAPNPESLARLRVPPDAIDRVDLTRLRIDESNPDDRNLYNTSSKPLGQPDAPTVKPDVTPNPGPVPAIPAVRESQTEAPSGGVITVIQPPAPDLPPIRPSPETPMARPSPRSWRNLGYSTCIR